MPDSPVTRRVHEQVLRYWQDLKGGRRFPAKQEIEPQAITEAWDWCFITHMRRGGVARGFDYDYIGHSLVAAYGANLTGQQCDFESAPHIASMLARLDEVTESGEPAIDQSTFENLQQMQIKYRCCLLPLGNERVEHILGCMRWKVC